MRSICIWILCSHLALFLFACVVVTVFVFVLMETFLKDDKKGVVFGRDNVHPQMMMIIPTERAFV